MITFEAISKKFGDTTALDRVSLTIAAGETLVLLGTSGSGKTTALKMINRLIEPDSGSVSIDGADVISHQPEALRRGIGYVMQNIGLFPHYTIEENIAVVPKLLKWRSDKTNTRISELIEKLKLPLDILKKLPYQLSGGQQQRVGLARALVADPAILLMDEPFGALDNLTRSSIQREFKELDELKKKTIVMVTHDVHEAFELADRICLMDGGKVVQTSKPKDLLFRPESDFARKFLDGERLALEFKTVSIKDLWEFLPQSIRENEVTQEPFRTEISVWFAMEQMNWGKNQQTVIKVVCGPVDGVIKSMDFPELAKAFHLYQMTV